LMLPLDLMRVRRRRGTIRPLYAAEDKLGLAETLISVFRAHVDGRRDELRDAVSRCEELGYDYRLVRGLAAVLEDRCVFQTRTFVAPAEARRAVFAEAGSRVVATEEERRRILASAAFRLGVSAEELDASLYADLLDEQVLTAFDAPTPQELLKEYNFALTLAILSQAHRLELTYRGVDENLERLGEALGRCHAHEAGGASRLTVERRPGRAGKNAATLEALLSRLILREGWRLTAEARHPPRSGKRYTLELREEAEGRLVKPAGPRRMLTAGAPVGAEAASRFPEVVIVDELASKLGVTEAEVRRMLERAGRRHVDLGGVLVTPGGLRRLEEALSNLTDMRLSTVVGVLRGLGCRRPLPVLEALGYAVEWAEDRGQSRVYRLGKRRWLLQRPN